MNPGRRVDALLDELTPAIRERDLPELALAGRQMRHAPYVERVRRLAEWVGSGRDLTPSRALRRTEAPEALRALGLGGAWRWRSAEDCEPLDRLWWGGFSSAQLHVDGDRVLGRPRVPARDEDWLQVGVECLLGQMDRLELRDWGIDAIARVLVLSCARGRGTVAWAELDAGQPFATAAVAVGQIADTGVVRLSEHGASLTEAGDYFVVWWLTERAERGGPFDR